MFHFDHRTIACNIINQKNRDKYGEINQKDSLTDRKLYKSIIAHLLLQDKEEETEDIESNYQQIIRAANLAIKEYKNVQYMEGEDRNEDNNKTEYRDKIKKLFLKRRKLFKENKIELNIISKQIRWNIRKHKEEKEEQTIKEILEKTGNTKEIKKQM